jgi:hypothetical protein
MLLQSKSFSQKQARETTRAILGKLVPKIIASEINKI